MHFQKEMLVYGFCQNCDIPVLELLDKCVYWEIVSLCIDFFFLHLKEMYDEFSNEENTALFTLTRILNMSKQCNPYCKEGKWCPW